MTKRQKIAAAVALAFACFLGGGTAGALSGFWATTAYGVKLIPQSTVPLGCSNPDRSCIWVNTADNNLYLHTYLGQNLNITGQSSGPFNGRILVNTGGLTGALAASVPVNTVAIVQSTGGGWITYDNATWSPLW